MQLKHALRSHLQATIKQSIKIWLLVAIGLLGAGPIVAAAIDDSLVSRNGLQLWLNADSLSLQNGAAVSQWADQSGNNNNVSQPVAGSQPIYQSNILNGHPVVRFDGVSQYLSGATTPGLMPTTATVIAVYRPLSVLSHSQRIISQPHNPAYAQPAVSWSLSAGSPNNTIPKAQFAVASTKYETPAGGSTPLVVANMLVSTCDGSAHRFYLNGALVGSTTVAGGIAYAAPQSFYVGTDLGGESLNGDVAEVLVYNRVLTDGERKNVELYMGDKYGIVTAPTLPSFSTNGLKLWLRADSLTLADGAKVGQWTDLSVGGNHATQGTAAYQPTYTAVTSGLNGKPSLHFNALAKQYLSVADNAGLNSSQITILAVARRVTGTSVSMIAEKGNGSAGYSLRYPSGTTTTTTVADYVNGNGAITPTTAPLAQGAFNVICGSYDQSTNSLYINGASADSNAYTSAITDYAYPLTIGGRGVAYNLDGDIAEILIYDHGISTAERRDIEAYFNVKYSLPCQPIIDTPSFSVQTGTYTTSQLVAISKPAGAAVYYTVDGSTPTANSTLYSAPITVTSTATLRAIGIKAGYQNSSVGQVKLTIDPSTDYVSRDGLQLWLRAKSVQQADGTAISTWADQSGRAHDAAQSTVLNQPAYIASDSGAGNQPVVKFSASDYMSVVDSGTLTPDKVTIYAIAKRDTAASASSMIVDKGSDSSAYSLRYIGSPNQARGYVNGHNVSGPVAAGSYQAICETYDLKDHNLFVNGSIINSSYSTAVTLNDYPVSIGGRGTSSSLNGEIVEVMIYGRALAEWERKQLDAYAYAQYSVGAIPVAQTPTFSKQAGIYANAQTVVINGSPGAKIYYSADASAVNNPPDPASAGGWQEYVGPISISATTKLRAIETKPRHLNSVQAVTMVVIDILTDGLPKNGLKLWLRADTLPLNNADVVQLWIDSSGNGNNFDTTIAPTYATQSTGGKPAVRFNAIDRTFMQCVNESEFAFNTFTLVCVANRPIGTDHVALLSRQGLDSNNNGYALRLTTQKSARVTINSYNLAGTATANESTDIIKPSEPIGFILSTYDSAGTKIDVDGPQSSEEVYSPAIPAIPHSTRSMQIGRRVDNALLFTGDISEIMIFDHAISDAEKRLIEAYVNRRYTLATAPTMGYPTFSPPTGTYATPQSVTIRSEDGGIIHYNENGYGVTPSFPVFDANSPISVSTTKTLSAIAVGEGYLPNPPIAWAAITIDPSTADVPRNGLKVWLRAEAPGIDASDLVSNLWDQSGSANHASQVDPAKRPTLVAAGINGMPTIKFTANTGSCLGVVQNDSVRLTQCSLIALVKSTGTGTSAIISKGSASSTGYILRTTSLTTVQSVINSNGASATLPPSPQPAFNLIMSTYDQSYNSIWVNGELKSKNSLIGSITDYNAFLGIGQGAGGYFFNGEMAELFVYDHALGETERIGLQNYIYRKYRVGAPTTLKAPEFSLQDGSYKLPQSLVITSAETAPIHYTLDGSTPTITSPLYSTPLALGVTTTVKAIATLSSYLDSDIATLKFTYKPETASELPADDGTPAGQQTDSDHDGVPDAVEAALGSNPNDPAQTGDGKVRIYKYDALHQLTDDGDRTYSYDREGNASSAPKL